MHAGKYIFISPEELKGVADFMKRRGRVTLAELVAESNKLIDLSPSEDVSAAAAAPLDLGD